MILPILGARGRAGVLSIALIAWCWCCTIAPMLRGVSAAQDAAAAVASSPASASASAPTPAPAAPPAHASASALDGQSAGGSNSSNGNSGEPVIDILSPDENSYISGPVSLNAKLLPANTAVERVSFFADGKLVCALEQPPFVCNWDSGPLLNSHVIRVVAALRDGRRVVKTIRTKNANVAERVDVHAVQVSVLVRDRGGNFVSGLKAKDFRLREDGVPQQITAVADEDAPLDVVMALDISGSMTDAIPDLKQAARLFLSALRERDAVTVLGFNDNIFTVSRRETNPATRARSLDRLAPWGGTALYDVISRGLSLLNTTVGRKGLVIFSDGDDQSSRGTAENAERDLQASDAPMYAVGLGRGAHEDNLKKLLSHLAEMSGGRAVHTRHVKELDGAFSEVVEELAHQYVLSYVPKNDKRDNTWRAITVETPGQEYHVRARQGYLARPASP
jgi:Ca-activated chloride channel family protein